MNKQDLEKRLQFVMTQCDQILANYNAALGAKGELLGLLNQINAKEAEEKKKADEEVKIEDTNTDKEDAA